MTSVTGESFETLSDDDIHTTYHDADGGRRQTDWTGPPSARSTPDFGALARCVEPVDTGEFLGEIFERRSLHVPRDEEGRFDDLLSVAEVQQMISSGSLRYPAFRLAIEGIPIDASSYTLDLPGYPSKLPDLADTSKVLTAFDAGATVALQGLQYTHPPLARFCRSLEAELTHPVQANAYFTPPDAQAFERHYDTHDVFSLQIAGEKRWLVFEPTLDLAAPGQSRRREAVTRGEPVLDVVLKPGDTLYLPRGWPHEVFTSDTLSLAVTIGVVAYSWVDAFRAAVDECMEELEFRRSVPESGEMEDELLALLAERLQAAEVARRRREQFVLERRPLLEGHLAEVQAVEEVTVTTPLERLPTVAADLYDSILLFEGRSIRFPDGVHEALVEVVTRQGSFTAAELPGLPDDESRLALARRLLREGFLRRSR
jgi:lysine-specific demethylase/histidyl-hydroxylase NO66